MSRHEPMTGQVTLAEASELISGDRQKDYGPPEENFARIADLWAVVLGVDVSPAQVALCMAQLKVARLINSPDHGDSWVDAAGYIGLGAQLAGDSR